MRTLAVIRRGIMFSLVRLFELQFELKIVIFYNLILKPSVKCKKKFRKDEG